MRVAYVCADPGVPVLGRKGCSIHVREIVKAMTARRLRVELFASRFDGPTPPELSQVTLQSCPVDPAPEAASREQACLAANGRFLQALSQRGPFDLVYERYSLWGSAGMEFADENGIPAILEVNAPLIREQMRYRALIDADSAKRIAGQAFDRATAIVAVSPEIAHYLKEDFGQSEKVHTVFNGVDVNRFRPRQLSRGREEGEPFTVGFCGSLKPWHGLPFLVDAFETFHRTAPDARLLLVGDGPDRQNLLRIVRERDLEPVVEFTGSVAHREVPEMLSRMDVAVAPYGTGEFYFSPLKVFEYMAMALPVVASQVGQLAHIIRQGVNGLLYSPGNKGALVEALDRLRLQPRLRKHLGRSARETVVAGHSWEAALDRILSLANVDDRLPRSPA